MRKQHHRRRAALVSEADPSGGSLAENRSGEGKTRQAMLVGVCRVALVVNTLCHTQGTK